MASDQSTKKRNAQAVKKSPAAKASPGKRASLGETKRPATTKCPPETKCPADLSPEVDQQIEAQAVALLLRSPHLPVSTIMDLLDLGDREFRALVQANPEITRLLDARRNGELPIRNKDDFRACEGCGELFIPYAGRAVCSDTCERIRRLAKQGNGARRRC